MRAILNWLQRTKAPSHIGVLGSSLAARSPALPDAGTDPRVEALLLDSMHTQVRYAAQASNGG